MKRLGTLLVFVLILTMATGCRLPRKFVFQWASPQTYANVAIPDPTSPDHFLWFKGYASDPYSIERREVATNATVHIWNSPTHERFQHLEHLTGDLYFASGDVPWVGLEFFGIVRLDLASDMVEFENQISFGHGEVFGPGTSDGENIYYYDFVSGVATVVAREAYTSELVWTRAIPSETGTLWLQTGANGELMALSTSAHENYLYRIDNETGEIIWANRINGESHGYAFSVDDVALVVRSGYLAGETAIESYNLDDGSIAWPEYFIAAPDVNQVHTSQELGGWRTYVSYWDTSYQQHIDLIDLTAEGVQVVGQYVQEDEGCSESVIAIVPVGGGMIFNGTDCTGNPGVLRYYREVPIRPAAVAAK